jgi:hypothetical protein
MRRSLNPHFFTAGLIVVFMLDLWLTSCMKSIGMAPMACLLSAVMAFILFVLRDLNKTMVDFKQRLLNRWWIAYLAVIGLGWILFYSYGLLRVIMPFLDGIRFFKFIDIHLMEIEVIILITTSVCSFGMAFISMSKKFSSPSRFWMVFTAWSFLIRSLIPVVWDPMPTIIFRYDGIFSIPLLYGLIMIALNSIHAKYKLPIG